MTSLRQLILSYGFHCSYGTLDLTFDVEVSAENPEMLLGRGIKAGHPILHNRAKILLLDRRHVLVTMRLPNVQNDLGWNEEHIQVCLTVREDKVEIRKNRRLTSVSH